MYFSGIVFKKSDTIHNCRVWAAHRSPWGSAINTKMINKADRQNENSKHVNITSNFHTSISQNYMKITGFSKTRKQGNANPNLRKLFELSSQFQFVESTFQNSHLLAHYVSYLGNPLPPPQFLFQTSHHSQNLRRIFTPPLCRSIRTSKIRENVSLRWECIYIVK